MGYFSNGIEGEAYRERYCDRCVYGVDCYVWLAHELHNYEERNKDDSILHMLIPRKRGGLGNGKCRMFYDNSGIIEALEMVRDADEDCKRDGLNTIPISARAKIDAELENARRK